jgi:hypothetical protein
VTENSSSSVDRPLGVAILSVLDIIFGVLAFLGGLVLLIIPGLMSMMFPYGLPFGILYMMVSVFAFFIIVMGIISMLLGYFLWQGNNLARILHIVFAIIGILFGILSLPGGIVNIIINGVIIYYLTRPHVVAFFTL